MIGCRQPLRLSVGSILGGLGGSVAQCLGKHAPTPIDFVAVDDQFGESGTPDQLMEKYGLGVQHVVDAVKKVIKRKSS